QVSALLCPHVRNGTVAVAPSDTLSVHSGGGSDAFRIGRDLPGNQLTVQPVSSPLNNPSSQWVPLVVVDRRQALAAGPMPCSGTRQSRVVLAVARSSADQQERPGRNGRQQIVQITVSWLHIAEIPGGRPVGVRKSKTRFM